MITCAALVGTASARQVVDLNFDWKFKLGENVGAEAMGFNDSKWDTVDVPHDFQVAQEWVEPSADEQAQMSANNSKRSRLSARGFKELGEGWYRKSFRADPAWRGKTILLDFEGIMLVGDVWLNGEKIGGTDYGYIGFEIDISGRLKFGEENVVVVRADTMGADQSRWYTGGGLYRNVKLVVKNRTSVARHGVFVTTPNITKEMAATRIQVELEHWVKGVEIKTTVFDPSGNQVAVQQQAARQPVSEFVFEVPSPRLWSCETPRLYNVEVELMAGGKILDRVEQAFGIRSLEFSPDFGFKLNGKKVFLKGFNLHHCNGALGAAAFPRAEEKRFEMLKAMGGNCIRTAHNPYSVSFMNLADKHGVLIVDEAFDKWKKQYAGGRQEFEKLWPGVIEEWVKRDRNHPSVILWSLGNELSRQIRNDGRGDYGVSLYKEISARVRPLDPTRLITVGLHPLRGIGIKDPLRYKPMECPPPALAFETDIASYNYRWANFKADGEANPDWMFYLSEASVSELPKDYFSMDRERVIGLTYWGAIGYIGESRLGWPAKGWDLSIVDHSLEPKPQFYLARSAFSSEPVIRAAVVHEQDSVMEWNGVKMSRTDEVEHWNWKQGQELKLVTYTNGDEVELLLNGRSLGIKKNSENPDSRNRIEWTVKYEPGTLKAIARQKGEPVAEHVLQTVSEPVTLKMVADNPAWNADGLDLNHIRVWAVDDQGRTVAMAANRLQFEVVGAASLAAVDNGDIYIDEPFVGNRCSLHRGTALAILRSGKEAGAVGIRVSSPGLSATELKLKTE
jgi:beta-galactosidase